MASIHNIILQMTGTSKDAERAIDRVKRAIATIANRRETEFQADATQLQAELQRIRAQLESLPNEEKVTIRADVAKALEDLHRIERQLDELGAEQADPRVEIQIVKAKADIDRIRRDLATIPNKVVEVDLARKQLEAEIAAVKAELAELGAQEVTPEVEVATAKARFELEAMRLQLASLPDKKTTVIDVDFRGKALAAIQAATIGLLRLETTFHRVSQGARPLGDIFGDLITKIRRFVPLVAGMVLLLGVSLVNAIAAVGASFVSAVGGLVFFANSLLGVLAPALGLVLALFLRFQQVFAAKTALDAAAAQASINAGKAARKAAAGHVQEAAAADAVRDAKEGLVTAQRNYEAAVKRAGEEIVEANRREREALADLRRAQRDAAEQVEDAWERVGDAQKRVAEAAVDAFEEMRRAALAARDAVLDLEFAQLDLADATDRVEDLQKEIADLLAPLSTLGESEFTEKLKDVDLGVGFEAQIITSLGIDADEDKVEKLSDLLRELERAKLNVKRATNDLDDAEHDLNATQQRQAEFTQQGINASEGYRNATERLSDAWETYNRTTRDTTERIAESRRAMREAAAEAQELRRTGVEGNLSVIAAAEGVRDAEQALERATRRATDAQAAQTAATEAGLPALLKAQKELAELTRAERRFLAVLIGAPQFLRTVFSQATDAIINALTDLLVQAGGVLLALRGEFTKVGEAWAEQIRLFRIELFDADSVDQFKKLLEGSIPVVEALGDAFRNFISTIFNLAEAGLPSLQRGMAAVANTTRRWRRSSEDTETWSKRIDQMTDSLGLWLDLLGSITALLFELAEAMQPLADEFVGWLKDGINSMREWIKSADGQKRIQQFFEETIPLAKELIKFVGEATLVFLSLFELAAPFLTDFFRGINLVLKVIKVLSEALNRLPTPVKSLGLVLIIYFLNPLNKLRLGVLGISFALGKFIALFTLIARFLGPAIEAAIDGIGKALSGAVDIFVNWIKDAIKALLDFLGIGSPSKLFAEIGKDMVLGLVEGFKSLVGALLDLGKFLVEKVIEGIKSLPGAIFGVAKWYVTTYFDGIKRLLGLYAQIGRFLVDKIVDGIKALPGLVIGAAGWFVRTALRAFKDLVNTYREIGRFVVDKVVDAVRSAPGAIVGAAKWFVRNLVGAFKGLGGELLDIGKAIAEGIVEGIKKVPGKIVDGAKGLVKKIGGVFGIGSPAKAFIPQGESIAEGIAAGLRSGIDAAKFDKSVDGIKDAIEKELPKTGEGALGALAAGLTSDEKPVAETAPFLVDTLTDATEAAERDFQKIGTTTLNVLVEGLRTLVRELRSFGAWLRGRASDSTRSENRSFEQIGKIALNRIVDGLRSAPQALVEFGGYLKNRVLDATVRNERVRQDLQDIGEWISRQITAGMRKALDKSGFIKGKGGFGRKLVEAVEDFFRIRSPSRVMMGVGENLTAGLLAGMNMANVRAFIRHHLGGFAKAGEGMVMAGPKLVAEGVANWGQLTDIAVGMGAKNLLDLFRVPDQIFNRLFDLPASVLRKLFGASGLGEARGDPFVARAIYSVGKKMNATLEELIAAFATAVVESGMRNVPPGKGDRDSIGPFQQRPSQGWGTVEQLINPFFQARNFFQRIRKLRGSGLSIGEMAQEVQRSAFPHRYALRIDDALAWLRRVGVSIQRGVEQLGDQLTKMFSGGPRDFNPAATAYLTRVITPLARRMGQYTSSGFRPWHFGSSWHGVNRARDYQDFPGPNAPSSLSDAKLEFFLELLRRFGKGLKELIYAGYRLNIKHGRLVPRYAVKDHYNHVHVALAHGGLVRGPTRALVGEDGSEFVLPLTRRVLTTLAQAIMAEVHDLNIEPKVVVLPVLSGARAWNTTPQQQPQTVTINVPPSAPAQPQPDPRITAALLGQEIRIRGGLR